MISDRLGAHSYYENSYPIPVGEEDRERLSAQEYLLNPYSMEWLTKYIPQGSKVMDVGCGHGGLAIALAKYIGPNGEVIAVDKSQEQLDIAQEEAKRQGVTNIRFIRADVNDLERLQEQCDFVHCRWLLAHIKKSLVPVAVRAMATQLRQGGMLLLEESGGDIYTWTPKTPKAFLLWLLAAKIQHFVMGTDRAVARRLLRDLPDKMSMTCEFEIPTVVTETEFHKSRFRAGIKPIVNKLRFSILKKLGHLWCNSWKKIEKDPKYVLVSRSLYQIAAHF